MSFDAHPMSLLTLHFRPMRASAAAPTLEGRKPTQGSWWSDECSDMGGAHRLGANS